MKIRTYCSVTLPAAVLGLLCAVTAPLRASEAAKAAKDFPAPPPLPKIQSLKLDPPALTLNDGRDERRVLVLGQIDSGQFVDLTAQAKFQSEAPCVEVLPSGYLRPKSKGSGNIVVRAAGLEAELLVKVEGAEVPT